MVGLLVSKGLLNLAYCDSLKYICKIIENVNNISDNSLQKVFLTLVPISLQIFVKTSTV